MNESPDPRLDEEDPSLVGLCLTCGMIESLRAFVESQGKLPTDHECEYVAFPTIAALEFSAKLEASRKQKMLPRCADCGQVPVEVFAVTEGKGRCRKCAKINWRAIWRQSVEGLMRDESETPLEQILKYGSYRG